MLFVTSAYLLCKLNLNLTKKICSRSLAASLPVSALSWTGMFPYINHVVSKVLSSFLKCFCCSIGNEQFYKDAVEQAGNFNMRMSIERHQRLPFIDSHTGVAQKHTDLFHTYRQRYRGLPQISNIVLR
jgi:hypothetical protein